MIKININGRPVSGQRDMLAMLVEDLKSVGWVIDTSDIFEVSLKKDVEQNKEGKK